MTAEFNSGLMGISGGGGMNTSGLIFNSMTDVNNEEKPVSVVIHPSCRLHNSAKWEASSTECFQPSQMHINILEISLIFNIIFLVAIILRYFWGHNYD